MILTNSDAANNVLKRIECSGGKWTGYGNDGRLTREEPGDCRTTDEGFGFRARWEDNPQGGDYGWGPLVNSEHGAIAALLAEFISSMEDDQL